MNKIFSTTLTLATTIALTTITNLPSEAEIINYDITVEIDSGALAGNIYFGSFSFDDDLLTGIDSELVDLEDFSFNFAGTEYTLTDDPNAGGEFLDGELLGLDFNAAEIFSFVPGFFSIDESFFAYDNPQPAGFGSVTYTLQNAESVPESSALLGLFTLVALGFAYQTKLNNQ